MLFEPCKAMFHRARLVIIRCRGRQDRVIVYVMDAGQVGSCCRTNGHSSRSFTKLRLPVKRVSRDRDPDHRHYSNLPNPIDSEPTATALNAPVLNKTGPKRRVLSAQAL